MARIIQHILGKSTRPCAVIHSHTATSFSERPTNAKTVNNEDLFGNSVEISQIIRDQRHIMLTMIRFNFPYFIFFLFYFFIGIYARPLKGEYTIYSIKYILHIIGDSGWTNLTCIPQWPKRPIIPSLFRKFETECSSPGHFLLVKQCRRLIVISNDSSSFLQLPLFTALYLSQVR